MALADLGGAGYLDVDDPLVPRATHADGPELGRRICQVLGNGTGALRWPELGFGVGLYRSECGQQLVLGRGHGVELVPGELPGAAGTGVDDGDARCRVEGRKCHGGVCLRCCRGGTENDQHCDADAESHDQPAPPGTHVGTVLPPPPAADGTNIHGVHHQCWGTLAEPCRAGQLRAGGLAVDAA